MKFTSINITFYLSLNFISSFHLKFLAQLFNYFHMNFLVDFKADNDGEIVPQHILSVIVDALKLFTEAESAAFERDATATRDRDRDPVDLRETEVTANIIDDVITVPGALQTKIIPFDSLQLSLENEMLSRSRNAAGMSLYHFTIRIVFLKKESLFPSFPI